MPPLPPTPWTTKPTRQSTSATGFPDLDGPRSPPITEDYAAQQNDEVEAIRSIFMENFEEVKLRPTVWNKPADHSFKLRLQAFSDPDTSITLSVTLTATYPRTWPLLAVEGTDHLRDAHRHRVDEVLQSRPKELMGSEMIYDIASQIQDVLEDAVQSRANDQTMPSLEEERAAKEAAAQKEIEMRNAEAERLKREERMEEERMLQQMVLEEVQRQKDRARESKRKSRLVEDDVAINDDDTASGTDRVLFDQPIDLRGHDGTATPFRAVSRFGKPRSGPVTKVHQAQPIAARAPHSATTLILKHVELDGRIPKHGILDLEKELEALKELSREASDKIVNVLAFKVDRPLNTAGATSERWSVSILMESADKGSLEDLLDMVGPLAVEKFRAWSLQLLEALEFYHCNGIVHQAVHPGNVLLVRPDSGAIVARLADGGFQRHLHELKDKVGDNSSHTSARSAYWTAPELAPLQPSRFTRKSDVWDLGVVFLQMLFGPATLQKYTSPTTLLESNHFSSSLEDFVRKIFKMDPKRRPNAFDLLASEFLRNNAPILAEPSSPSKSRLSSTVSLRSPSPFHARQEAMPIGGVSSRYANDFQELGRLGKGGFGEVFKSRNKFDGQIYAVKKITQSARGSLSDVLSEIMLLSRLNHPYVVRYFNAWPEEDSVAVSDAEDETPSVTESSSISPKTGQTFEFGQSTGGLDIISSTGGPQIQFGYDSEDDSSSASEDDESNSPSKVENIKGEANGEDLQLKRTRSESRIVKSTLYIQMEYCEKRTLRDLLRQGLHDDVDNGWRLLRQILEGLDHIHGHGIIHRDLKPDNIFIDASGNPRIGDFGLATSGKYYLADKASALQGEVNVEMTRSIGTAMYVAPELRSNVNSHYNEKVDMYSLGIIFFEMCYPLRTGMERDQVLRALRNREHPLPVDFQQAEKAVQADIINMLVSHRPSDRPSTSELLHGGKLPIQIEDDIFRQALQGISDSNSPYYTKMMSALFNQPTNQAKDFAWDMDSRYDTGPNDLLLQGIVKETLTAIFRHHGAVEMDRPLLFPRSKYYASNTAQVLDVSGTLLQLPYDLTLPHARLLAKQAPAAQKTFSFGTVYRASHAGGQPQSHGEVDFDIVSYDTLDVALKEAEVIKVIDEVVDGFPSLKSDQMCYHLNHSDLLDLVMGFCRIPVPQRPAVKEILSKLNILQWTWTKIRNELRSPSIGISSISLDDLARFDFRETPQKAYERLRGIFEGSECLDKCPSLFAHLDAVHTYVKRFDVQRKIYISPLSSFNDKFYRNGLLFQCLFDSKRRQVFAAGGRYDALIQDHRPPIQRQTDTCHAVGFNLGWEKLYASMARLQKSSSKTFLKKADEELRGQWAARRCDVLVASLDSKALRSTGINIVRQLWAHDVGAELAVDIRSPEALLAYYKEDKHSWIVLIKQDGGHGEPVLKVKSMVRKEDAEIRGSELVSWLRGEMKERDVREGTKDRVKLIRHTSHQDTTPSGGEREQDVRMLVALHKGKRPNRKTVSEAAPLRARELVNGFLDGPIAAVDVRDEILDAIQGTTLSDPDSWRKVIQSAPVGDRAYLTDVHGLMSDLGRERKGGPKIAFIYNFRTGACIYYDLRR